VARPARLRARRDPQQLPRLAHAGEEGRAGAAHVARYLRPDGEPHRQPPHDERRGRHHAPLLGAELAAQPVGLPCSERDRETLRARAHSGRVDGRGLAVRLRGARAVLRHRRARDRGVRAGGQRAWPHRPTRQPVRGTTRARVSDASAPLDRFPRAHGRHGARARLAPFPRPGGDQHRAVRRPFGMRLSRVLQQGRLPARRQEQPAPHDDPAGTRHRQPARGDTRARDDGGGRRTGARDRRQLRGRKPGVLPAGACRAARVLHVRERATPTAL
jgi:hypothetical protein